MDDYYKRIKKIQNELTALKTSAALSATTVASSQQEFALSIPMKLLDSYTCQSANIYTITVMNERDDEFLSMLSINTGDPEGRIWNMAEKTAGLGNPNYELVVGGNRSHIYEITVGGNSDDLARLKAGQAVNIYMTFTVTATTRFTITINERGA